MTRLAIEIREHPASARHQLVLVTTPRGRVYAATWAGTVTVAEAEAAWRSHRAAFRPYDTSTATYTAPGGAAWPD